MSIKSSIFSINSNDNNEIVKKREIEYFRDDDILKLLNENPSDSDLQIDRICRENPEKEESIRLTASLVHHYRSESPRVNDEEIAAMWDNVLAESQTKKPKRVIGFIPIFSFAASIAALILLAFFFRHSSNDQMRKFAEEQVADGDKARIILSDGSDHVLKSNDSHIIYNNDGKEIVIEEKNNQAERLDNKTASKTVFNQIIIPYGQRYSLTLSDGSAVQLNSGSKLVFPAMFSDARREVYLEGVLGCWVIKCLLSV